ncbi:MAG: glycosyltransferase, partial [Lachnospiraceae bacterium]|nr:glycosyltransferase [Lachnospiraceae bacterium]
LDDRLQAVKYSKDNIISLSAEIIKEYYIVSPEAVSDFTITPEYQKLFTDIDCSGYECVRPANLDVIFENVMEMPSGELLGFDYEWTFDISVPKDYIYYRILSHVYDKYDVLQDDMTLRDFIKKTGIIASDDELDLFERMELCLMTYLYNGGEYQRSEGTSIDPRSDEVYALKCRVAELENQKGRLLHEIGIRQGIIDRRVNRRILELSKLNGIRRRYGNAGMKEFLKVRFHNKKTPYDTFYSESELASERSHNFTNPVTISVVTPLFKTPERFLREMIESVINQTYGGWDFCMVDFSPEGYDEVERICREYTDRDKRLHYVRDYDNRGIADNTNTCISHATGEYLALLDHDDVLHPAAFFEVMKEIEKGADFVYTDEVKFTDDFRHLSVPNYKPDFSAFQLQVQNYICHLNVYKKSLLDEAGLYRSVCDGSQDHDIVLRLTEHAKHIAHVPKVLYYWRLHSASTASNIAAKPYATWSGIRATSDSFERRGLSYKTRSLRDNIPCYRIEPCMENDAVRIVIYGVQQEEETEEFRRHINAYKTVYHRPCSYLRLKNSRDDLPVKKILEESSEEYILFIKEGTSFYAESFFDELLHYAKMKGVAAVDAYTYMSGQRICSAGVSVSRQRESLLGGKIMLRGHGLDMLYEGYEIDFSHVREVCAVSGFCTMVSKSDFLPLADDGDRSLFSSSLRAEKQGKHFIITPHADCAGDFEAEAAKLTSSPIPDFYERNYDPYFSDNILKYWLEK